MKTDFSFKLVAAIVFAGVIIAFASPTPRPVDPHSSEAATAPHEGE